VLAAEHPERVASRLIESDGTDASYTSAELSRRSDHQFQAGASEGYVIPIDTAISVAKSIESGDFSTAIHPAATAFLGVDVRNSGYFRSGAYVAGVIILDVIPSSPAEKAGLVQGDVITSINSTTIASTSGLDNLLLDLAPSAKVSLHWIS
jgi:S1-C subfamily serine protease